MFLGGGNRESYCLFCIDERSKRNMFLKKLKNIEILDYKKRRDF